MNHDDAPLRSGLAACARRFVADRSGATAVEYALIAAGIGAFIATTVWSFGTTLNALYGRVAAIF